MKKTDTSRDTADRVGSGDTDGETDNWDAAAPEHEIAMPDLKALRQRVRDLEAKNATMREIVLRVAEARMARDPVTQIESCLHCSLKRGGEYGYTGKHADTCIVSRARALGF